ncbi:MAG: Gfo/Idh/MocA family oxidoreductase [Acetobacteraceae bacterium]|nr:Gfo/Idh/MocA family oxidoreductase [Acetobacteraceae bacterium]
MSRKIRLAMIGTGWMGHVHSEAYRRLGPLGLLPQAEVELALVVGRRESTARELQSRYGYTRWSTDWREAVEDPSIDAVDISFPNALHHDIAIACARAGKAALCEKPLGLNASESEEMYRVAEECKVLHMTAFNYRWVPALIFARSLIESGELGRLYHFKGVFCQDFAADPDVPFTWRFGADSAGAGSIATLGSHLLDLARWLVGDVASLASLTETFVEDRPVEAGSASRQPVSVDDTTCLVMRFKNGAVGTAQTTWVARGRRCQLELEIHGSRGSLIFDVQRMNELQLCEEGPIEKRGFKTLYIGQHHPYGQVFGLKTGMNLGWRDSFVLQACEFLKAVVEGTRPRPSYYDGWQADRIVEQAVAAARKRAWVDL